MRIRRSTASGCARIFSRSRHHSTGRTSVQRYSWWRSAGWIRVDRIRSRAPPADRGRATLPERVGGCS